MAIQILFADSALNVIGDPLADWDSLDVTLKYNEPAAGQVTAAAWPELMENLQPGNRVIIIRDGEVWTTGPMEIVQDFTWGVGDTNEPDPGKVTFTFSDDLALMAQRVTYTNTGSTWTSSWSSATPSVGHAPSKDENDVGGLGASVYAAGFSALSLPWNIAKGNCGPTAVTDRRIAHLTFPTFTDPLPADSAEFRTRYEPLLDALRRAIAGSGWEIGFRTRLTSDWSSVAFEVYQPTDKSSTARFSRGLGNLRAVNFKWSAPTATRALLSSPFSEAKTTAPTHPIRQQFYQYTNTSVRDSWNMLAEKVVEVSAQTEESTASSNHGLLTTTGSATMVAAGQETLVEGTETYEMSTVTVDTEDLKAGRDFYLGDYVTVELPTGLSVTTVVQAIQLKASPQDGETVITQVATHPGLQESATSRALREMSSRLGKVEARGNAK